MTRERTGCVVLVAALIAGMAGFVWRLSAKAAHLQSERIRVHGIVANGMDISAAQALLKVKGYQLAYETPIRPTASDYVQQLVVIGDRRPTPLDTFFYTTGWRNPFPNESPYVVIDAGPDGIIVRVD